MRHRVVSVGEARNRMRLEQIAALAMDNVLPREMGRLPDGRLAAAVFAEEFLRLISVEHYVLTRQVR